MLAVWLTVGLAVAGCSNPVDGDDEHEHALDEIYRLEIVADGTPVVVVEDAAFADGDPDTLFVTAGTTSSLYTLEAALEDGDELHLDELEDEYGLGYNTDLLDAAVATFQPSADRWSFRLEGMTADTTVLQLELLHLDHADYRTPQIPVVVRSPSASALRPAVNLSGGHR